MFQIYANKKTLTSEKITASLEEPFFILLQNKPFPTLGFAAVPYTQPSSKSSSSSISLIKHYFAKIINCGDCTFLIMHQVII